MPELVALIVAISFLALFCVIAGASVAGSLGTIADELRRLNDHLERTR